MSNHSRRDFIGLAAIGLGATTLRATARPTAPSGAEDIPSPFGPSVLQGQAPQEQDVTRELTERNIEGPYFRNGSPYRAKVTPPLAPGDVLLITGRVWAFDTRKPIPGARIHIWQASELGRYDNDDRKHPPKENVFDHRARMLTDEGGLYEYETIHPGRYKVRKRYRPSHIHYRIEAEGYKTLITQLYFSGDPYNKTDRLIKKSLTIELQKVALSDSRSYAAGRFDIVLAKA